MSDHDPNGDDNFRHRSVPVDDDDGNPMQRIGYGRGDDYMKKAIEPTIPMEAVEVLTVKDIIHRLVERNLQGWRALPEKIRDRMLDRPNEFQLIGNKMYSSTSKEYFDYDILYNGTVWRYNAVSLVWVIQDIIQR